MTLRSLLGGCLLVCSLAHAQVNNAAKHCVSPHELMPNGTGLYSSGDPCPFNYQVPSGRQSQLLKENPQCKAWGSAEVYCSTAVTANYGQVRTGSSERSAPKVAQGPTRPDGDGHQVPYPETTLAHMTFLPTRTAEEIRNMAEDFMQQ